MILRRPAQPSNGPPPEPAMTPDTFLNCSDLLDEPPGDIEPAAHELLSGLPLTWLDGILSNCTVLDLQKGDVLIEPGVENHNLYLLISGNLCVQLDRDDPLSRFPIVPGECIGEMSIIEDRLTSAWVTADSACRLIVMPEAVFWDDFIRLPGAVRNLLYLLTRRTRKSNAVILNTQEARLRLEQQQKELETAARIQANILPRDPLLPRHPQVEAAALMEPALEVGGDFYDAFPIDSRHVCLTVGDVAGKGMPAALFMVRVMTLLRIHFAATGPLEATLTNVNRTLCQHNDEMMFATLCLGVLDVQTGVLSYVNGGHNPPFLARQGSAFAALSMPRGMLLGIKEDAVFEVASITLQPGDSLLLYTDGVIDAEDHHSDFFSAPRARDVLSGVPVNTPVAGLVDALHQAILRFAGGTPQVDDITMLALRYRG